MLESSQNHIDVHEIGPLQPKISQPLSTSPKLDQMVIFFLNVRYMNIEIFAQWLTACKVVDILVHLTAMRHPTVEVPNSVYWMLPTGFSTMKMKLMFENFFWWRYGAIWSIWVISKLIQVPSFYNKNNWYRITTGTCFKNMVIALNIQKIITKQDPEKVQPVKIAVFDLKIFYCPDVMIKGLGTSS